MLLLVYVAFAATHMFPAIGDMEMLLFVAAYFAAAIGMKPRHETAAYLGRGYVVWYSCGLVGACVVWLAGWKDLEELEKTGRDGMDGNLTM